MDLVFGISLHVKIVAVAAGCTGLAFCLGWLGAGVAGPRALPGGSFSTPFLLGTGAVLIAVLVSGAIVRIALAPLRQLELAAGRVERGDPAARATVSRLADRDMARLARAFNAALDRQALYRSRLGELALRGLRAEESASRRVAIELREGPGQRLSSLLLQLRAAGIDGDEGTLAGLVEEARGEITAVLDVLGRHGGDRAERLLEDLGMAGAVDWKARQVTRVHALDVSATVGLVDPVLSRSARRILFRVVQEALENVGRHANASSARVGIRRERHRVVAEIVDDGRGFEPGPSRYLGLGLLELETTVAELGGKLKITSALPHGTCLRAELPVCSAGRASFEPDRP